jgi:electron transfer flavoprotein alpha subunit
MLRRSALRSLRQRSYALFSRAFSTGESGVLVLADHDNKSLGAATLNAVAAASQLPGNVSVLVGGENCKGVADEAAKIAGVSTVILAVDAAFGHNLAENFASLLVEVQGKKNFSHIVASTTAFGKDVLPRAAVALDSQPIADVVEIKDPVTFVRPVYAGNALATVKSANSVHLLTIRGTAFEAAETGTGTGDVETFTASSPDAKLSKWQSDALSASDRPELTSAGVVVSGGRALKSEEKFGMIYDLADQLKGAAGASRAAVDAGYAPNEIQVGQTGKVVAPDLYIAVSLNLRF